MRGLALALVVLAGCAERRCEQACAKLYDEGECGIPSVGGEEYTLDDCQAQCEAATEESGSARGDYDPQSSVPENQEEVDLWVDCVEENGCGDLEEGACASWE